MQKMYYSHILHNIIPNLSSRRRRIHPTFAVQKKIQLSSDRPKIRPKLSSNKQNNEYKISTPRSTFLPRTFQCYVYIL